MGVGVAGGLEGEQSLQTSVWSQPGPPGAVLVWLGGDPGPPLGLLLARSLQGLHA